MLPNMSTCIFSTIWLVNAGYWCKRYRYLMFLSWEESVPVPRYNNIRYTLSCLSYCSGDSNNHWGYSPTLNFIFNCFRCIYIYINIYTCDKLLIRKKAIYYFHFHTNEMCPYESYCSHWCLRWRVLFTPIHHCDIITLAWCIQSSWCIWYLLFNPPPKT